MKQCSTPSARIRSRATMTLSAIAWSLFSTGLAAQDCATVASCAKLAIAHKVEQISPIAAGDKCPPGADDGCLEVRISGKLEQYLPFGKGLRTDARIPPSIGVDDGFVEPMYLPLAAVDPGAGITVEIEYPGIIPTDGQPHAFFAFGEDRAGTRPIVALGVQRGGLVLGRRGVAATNGAEGWVPVWNPDPLVSREVSRIYVRFLPSGKVRIDVLQTDDIRNFTWSSNLLDTGWPIKSFPAAHGAKEFLVPYNLIIGLTDWLYLPSSPMASGVSRISMFKTALSDAEMLSVFAAQNGLELSDSDLLAFRPCNTGAYLSSTAPVPTKTPCGPRQSSLAAIDLSIPFAVKSGTTGWRLQAPPGPVQIAEGTDASLLEAVGMGANNFVLVDQQNGWALQQKGDQVISAPLLNPAPASQQWHFTARENDPTKFVISSLGNGKLVTQSETALALSDYSPAIWTIDTRGSSKSATNWPTARDQERETEADR